jgi:hypothetical protein
MTICPDLGQGDPLFIHSTHGDVCVETIYREYSVYDDKTSDGHIPSNWYVAYSGDEGETYIDPVEDFLSKVSL